MRLFIAFDISKEAEKELLNAQRELKGARFTLAKHFHLTLKFLGDATPQKAEKVKQALSTIPFKQLNVKLGGVGCFPTEKQPRVVWMGVEPPDIICSLQKQIDNSLSQLFPKEKNFQPHITLARVKEITDIMQFTQSLSGIKTKRLTFEITRFKLVESTLGREEPAYRILAEFP